MRKTLLEKCEQMVAVTTWPYLQKNLRTQKIFSDLYQYYVNEGPQLSSYNNRGRMGSLPSFKNLNEQDSKKLFSLQNNKTTESQVSLGFQQFALRKNVQSYSRKQFQNSLTDKKQLKDKLNSHNQSINVSTNASNSLILN